MNPIERDYSVFGIWPAGAQINAQVLDGSGKLVTSAGALKITWEALADSTGSVNTTSVGKTNFWPFAKALFGGSDQPGVGIAGNLMSASGPQQLSFDPALNRFTAPWIPLTAYDDNWNVNYSPMVRVIVRDASGTILATARTTLPVSNEVECRSCHASGVNADARPLTGYVNDPNPNRDFKLNILALHDGKNRRNPAYTAALATAGYGTGLLDAATAGTPVLCTACHASNLRATPGISGLSQFTTAMHGHHASIIDPATSDTLDNSTNRSACYNCHPGNTTQSLRGAMGHSADGSGNLQIQCQNCHGNMSKLADPARTSYAGLPRCQSCHSTSAPYQATSAFDATGTVRTSSDTTFATTGTSVFSASTGHGGLQCAACHGPAHAEYPSNRAADNLQSQDLQGAAGVIGDCAACHKSGVSSTNGGPHGLHTAGAAWINAHPDTASRNRTQCTTCHGGSYQGTVISRVLTNRTLSSQYGNIPAFRGYQVGCYTCHNGPGGNGSSQAVATLANTSSSVIQGQAVTIPVNVPAGATLKIVTQPARGVANVSGNTVVYRPTVSFEGTDPFTYSAISASNKDSGLGTAQVSVRASSRPVVASVANAASYVAGTVAPGMIAFFTGTGMGPANLATFGLSSGGFMEKSVQTTRVLFDGVASPVIYASPAAVAAIVPYSVQGKGSTAITVEYNGIASTALSATVADAGPGIFTVNSSGTGPAAAISGDSLNTEANPVQRGAAIALYLTGDGAETPQPKDGVLVNGPYPATVAPISVTIGGKPANVVYSGAAPASVAGLMQLNAVVAADADTGKVPVTVTIGGVTSQANVFVYVR